MPGIKILHLSDLHYDSSKPKDTQIILDALWKDLDNFRDIDFIVFSGDLVKAGDKKDDFEKALKTFIVPLLEKTKLSVSDFFIAPGNHDIQRSEIDEYLEEGLKAKLKDRESLNVFLDTQMNEDFRHIERLDHFNEFKNRFKTSYTTTFNKLFSTYVIEKKNIKIGIACLNSTWRATGCGSMDKGRLLIGERQIDDALKYIKDCDIKIALYHHSLDWLMEYDLNDSKKRLSREFGFLFCGHLHDPNLELVQSFHNKAVLIQGGSLNNGRSYYNGYSAVCFDAQSGKGIIYLRSYYDDRRCFDKAVNKCEDGEMPIHIKKKDESGKTSGKREYRMKNKKEKIGDVYKPSVYRGENSINIVGKNIIGNGNIFGDIGRLTISSQSKTPEQESEEALKAGLDSFELKDYKSAFDNFQKARKLTPKNERVQLFYCLSFLSGKPMGSIHISEMMDINNILINIVNGNNQEAANLARLVLGIIRYDYYKQRNYHYDGLPSEAIFKYLEKYYPTKEEKKFIRSIIFSDTVRILFNLV